MASNDPIDDELTRLRKDLLQFLTEDMAQSGLAGKDIALSDAIRKDIADVITQTLKADADKRYSDGQQSLNTALQEQSARIEQQIATLTAQADGINNHALSLQAAAANVQSGQQPSPQQGEGSGTVLGQQGTAGGSAIRTKVDTEAGGDSRTSNDSKAAQTHSDDAQSTSVLIPILLALAIIAANAFAIYYFTQRAPLKVDDKSPFCTLASRIDAVKSDPDYADALNAIKASETEGAADAMPLSEKLAALMVSVNDTITAEKIASECVAEEAAE